jgi:hypothetical protein
MKTLAIGCAALMLLAATASADELAVSKSTLNTMGLGGMQTMSNSDGMAVRGKATFATVFGGSVANWPPGQSSANNYAAGAGWLGSPSSAGGGSFSFAGNVSVVFVADGGGTALIVQAQGGISGGGAFAFASN